MHAAASGRWPLEYTTAIEQALRRRAIELTDVNASRLRDSGHVIQEVQPQSDRQAVLFAA